MYARFAWMFAGFAVACLGGGVAGAEMFSGQVLAVVDGDLVSVLHDNVADPVYLFGVDCPERGQAYDAEAKQFVADKCLKQNVTVTVVDVPPDVLAKVLPAGKDGKPETRLYGTVVLNDGTVLNNSVLEAGLAWWDARLAPDDRELKRINAKAMEAKKGLWADSLPLAPWDFRKRKADEEALEKEKAALTASADEAAVEAAETESPLPVSNEGVFITKTSRDFHKPGCRYLDKTQKVIGRTDAETKGYSPCVVCYPDAMNKKTLREAELRGETPAPPKPVAAPPIAIAAAQSAPKPVKRAPAAAKAPAMDFSKIDSNMAMELVTKHRPRVYMDPSGQPAGLTADYISQIPYASSFGFQDNDVIQGVNGVPVRSIPDALALVEQFQNQKQFEVSVLRNGVPTSIMVNVP